MTIAYDAADRRTMKLDPRLNRASYLYDAAGQTTAEIYADGTRVSYLFDETGNRTRMHDSVGITTTAYDAVRNVTRHHPPLGGRVTYAFDAANRRRFMIDPDGGRFTYGYDDAGRTTRVINPQSKHATLGYDAAGRQTLQVHGNGSRSTQLFDGASRVVGQIQADGVGMTRRTTNLYDATSKRTAMIESSGTRTSWTYDNSGQLKREQRNGTGSFDVTHLFDPAGNRTLMIDSGTRTTATFDAANQLLVERTNSARTSYQFDNNGNTTRKDTGSALTIYQWDVRNRMTAAQPVGTPVTCTYSGDNKRVKKQVGGATKQFLYDFENLLRESDGSGNVENEYTSTTEQYGDLLSAYGSGSTKYYEFDPQYSTEALLDDSGSVTDRYQYRAFGMASHPTGSSTQPHTFVGRQGYQADSEIDLYYVRRRYYDPVTGRWRSEDTGGYLAGDANLFRNCFNDPVNSTDPSGEQCSDDQTRRYRQWLMAIDSYLMIRPDDTGVIQGRKELVEWYNGMCQVRKTIKLGTLGYFYTHPQQSAGGSQNGMIPPMNLPGQNVPAPVMPTPQRPAPQPMGMPVRPPMGVPGVGMQPRPPMMGMAPITTSSGGMTSGQTGGTTGGMGMGMPMPGDMRPVGPMAMPLPAGPENPMGMGEEIGDPEFTPMLDNSELNLQQAASEVEEIRPEGKLTGLKYKGERQWYQFDLPFEIPDLLGPIKAFINIFTDLCETFSDIKTDDIIAIIKEVICNPLKVAECVLRGLYDGFRFFMERAESKLLAAGYKWLFGDAFIPYAEFPELVKTNDTKELTPLFLKLVGLNKTDIDRIAAGADPNMEPLRSINQFVNEPLALANHLKDMHQFDVEAMVAAFVAETITKFKEKLLVEGGKNLGLKLARGIVPGSQILVLLEMLDWISKNRSQIKMLLANLKDVLLSIKDCKPENVKNAFVKALESSTGLIVSLLASFAGLEAIRRAIRKALLELRAKVLDWLGRLFRGGTSIDSDYYGLNMDRTKLIPAVPVDLRKGPVVKVFGRIREIRERGATRKVASADVRLSYNPGNIDVQGAVSDLRSRGCAKPEELARISTNGRSLKTAAEAALLKPGNPLANLKNAVTRDNGPGEKLVQDVADAIGPCPCDHLPEPCMTRCKKEKDKDPNSTDECKKRGYTYLLAPPDGASWSAYIVKHCGGASRTVWSGMGTSHGHHIVMKKGREGFANTVWKSQQILCKNEIDPFCGKENLIIARNWCHSSIYAEYVLKQLMNLQTSGRKLLEAELLRIAKIFNDTCNFGQMFVDPTPDAKDRMVVANTDEFPN